MDLNFEKFYKLSMTCLRANGAHPAVARDFKWAVHFLLMYTPYMLFNGNFGYNIVFFDIKLNDILLTCSHGILVVILVVVSFQYGVLVWYQDNFKYLFRTQQHFFDLANGLHHDDQMVVYEYAKRGRWVAKLWLVSTLVTLFMFPLRSVIDTAYTAFAHGRFQLYPFCEAYYPFGVDKVKNRTDVFIIIYILNMLHGVYDIFMYVGFTPLGPICILNACAQIELVTRQVNLLFDAKNYNSEETKRKLKKIILDMDEIYNFVNEINTVFQVLYELCLKASAIMIPVSIFLIIESVHRGQLSLDYIMFSYTASMLCFVPCYYSDLLMEKGENLRLAMYSCGWQNVYDKSVRKSLLIMLTRATRPISINSIFRTICLDAFAELCHQAYAIFNLMNASL